MEDQVWALARKKLDLIEEGDWIGVVEVFLRVKGLPLLSEVRPKKRKTVNPSNFSSEMGIPYHRMQSWIKRYESYKRLEETTRRKSA